MTPTPRLRSPGLRLMLALPLPLAASACHTLADTSQPPAPVLAPDPRVQADPSCPGVGWQLSINRPDAARMTDSLRIAVRPTPGELQVYKGAVWAKRPADMVGDAILHALEDSGRIPAVARQGSGIAALAHFAAKLKAYLHGILSRCRHRLNTSIVEGINNTIKVIKRRAYGYRDQEYFFLKIRAAFPGIQR